MEERLRRMEPVRPAPPPPITVRAIVPSSSQKFSPSPDTTATPVNLTVDSSTYVTADESTKTILVSTTTSPEPNEHTSDTLTRSESIETSEEEAEADTDDEGKERVSNCISYPNVLLTIEIIFFKKNFVISVLLNMDIV